ncbi:MAG TPA: hypothetical protein VFX89_10885 [Gammaproteobacteria bacterium]|nr:hypothetical protein [Gammaproteobacteria bacterium]
MSTREDFAALTAAIAEAVAACEAAQADFIRIKSELDALIVQSRVLTIEHIDAEARAHRRLASTIDTLTRRLTNAGFDE